MSYRSIRENTGRNGTIGSGLLSRFYVTFDYFNNRLYLKKNKKYKMPFEYNMSGMDFEAMPPMFNEFKVSYIREGSPAEKAGIQLGDEILVVNGLSVGNLRMGDVFNLLSSKSGRTIRIKLRRGDEVLFYKFKLERLI